MNDISKYDFNQRHLFKKSLFVLGLVLCSMVHGLVANDTKPNVLVIMADDLGYHDLGFQGSDHIESPHLDQLAKTGVVFTDAHVSASVCSPSRAGFMTGRYQTRFGHEANVPRKDDGMDLNERTMGQAFQGLGYKTSIIGKWHLGATDEQYPNQRGFDDFYGLREGSRSYWYNPKRSDKKGNPHAMEKNGEQVKFEGYLSDRLADHAISFMDTHAKDPFFMFLSFTAPHAPLEAKPEDLERFHGNAYAAMIYNMDQNIGRVMAKLEALNIKDNTIVWFLSDNGGVVAQADNSPLKGIKGLKFDGGHRIPFVLNWPKGAPTGMKYDKLTSSLDIFATSYTAAGGEPFTDRPLDGVDLIPHLQGVNKNAPHAKLYWRRLGAAAMREGDWKLIRIEGGNSVLYNLKNDIGETRDLSASQPEKKQAMLAQLKSWESEMVAPLWGEEQVWVDWTFDTHEALFKNKPMPTKDEVKNNKKIKNKH